MAKTTTRAAARKEEAAVIAHAEATADAEVQAQEEATAPPAEADEYTVIALGHITEMMQQLPNPAHLLGEQAVAGIKGAAREFYGSALMMAPFDVGRRGLAYEYDGRVIVRTHGRLMQSMARDMLTQAYYSCRTALREYRRWKMVDLAMREQRQVDFQRTRPGQDEEGVREASWLDGDDRYDPTRQAAQRAEDAMLEAATYVALAFTFVPNVMKLTDGEAITSRVRAKPRPQDPNAAKPIQTAAERLRAAGGWVGPDAGPQPGSAPWEGDPAVQDEAA